VLVVYYYCLGDDWVCVYDVFELGGCDVFVVCGDDDFFELVGDCEEVVCVECVEVVGV